MADVDKSLPGDQPLPLDEFYEEDEPVEKIVATFEAGEHGWDGSAMSEGKQFIDRGRRIYRYVVPVDDQWHAHRFRGEVLAVNCRQLDVVEFWAVEGGEVIRHFRVFGTGHPVTSDARYVGTAVTPGGELVWHLVEEAQ